MFFASPVAHVLSKCSIPVFDDLLPRKHNRIIRELLFELATWHAFAKLWQHTETTVTDLENSGTRLGKILRIFKNELCSEYAMKDLPSEEAPRGRRKAAIILKAGGQDAAAAASTSTGQQAKKSKFRGFRMETYKLHSFPDLAASIRAHGVSENTSSKNVCRLSLISTDLFIYYSYRERANVDGRNNFIPEFPREIMSVELRDVFIGN